MTDDYGCFNYLMEVLHWIYILC